jgi:hypothetical protein
MAASLPSRPRPSAQQLKVPKGTQDYFGKDAILRDQVLYVLVCLCAV